MFVPLIIGLALSASGESAQSPWPSDKTDLVLAFETAYFRTPAFALDDNGKEILLYEFTPRGCARKDRNYAMVVGSGSFVAARIGKSLFSACRKSGAFTIEAYIMPAYSSAATRGDIIAFASDNAEGDLFLSQEKAKLVFRLNSGDAGALKQVELCALTDTKGFHLVITYSEGVLICWKDGKVVTRTDLFTGDLVDWSDRQVVLGSNADGSNDWLGTLEGIAIFGRAITAEQAAQDFQAYSERIAVRKAGAIVAIKAELLECTPVPTANEISPYTRILVGYKYKVEKVLSGKLAADIVVVCHWGIMQKKILPIAEREKGKSYELRLEKHSDNPQLEGEWLWNDFGALKVPFMYDVGEVQR